MAAVKAQLLGSAHVTGIYVLLVANLTHSLVAKAQVDAKATEALQDVVRAFIALICIIFAKDLNIRIK